VPAPETVLARFPELALLREEYLEGETVTLWQFLVQAHTEPNGATHLKPTHGII